MTSYLSKKVSPVSHKITDSELCVSEEVKERCKCSLRSNKSHGWMEISKNWIRFHESDCKIMIGFGEISSIYKREKENIDVILKGDSHHVIKDFSFTFQNHEDRKRIYQYLHSNFKSHNQLQIAKTHPFEFSNQSDEFIKQIFETSKQNTITFEDPSPSHGDDTIHDDIFDIPLLQFVYLFIADDSSFLIAFYTHLRYTDLKISKWRFDDENRCFSRTIEYEEDRKMINAIYTENQIFTLKNSKELQFETSTKIQGHPFSDAYKVISKWRVNDEGGKSRIKVWSRIHFIKNVSILRGRLHKDVNSSSKHFVSELIVYLRNWQLHHHYRQGESQLIHAIAAKNQSHKYNNNNNDTSIPRNNSTSRRYSFPKLIVISATLIVIIIFGFIYSYFLN